ncbi:hypothetical protein TRAPUB_7505, partial [Trametes pubescens]
PFLFTTKQMSVSDRALVQDVIPYMDILTHHLNSFKSDVTLAPAVRAAAQRGRSMLDKYYTLTDDTMIYRVAMILHPQHKVQYFRDEGWPEEWVQTAIDLVREEWNTFYKPKNAPALIVPPAAAAAADKGKGKGKASSSGGRRSAQGAAQLPTAAMFKSISRHGKPSQLDALEVYLQAPPQPDIEDPLAYWNVVLKTGNTHLAQMALDFLSIPSTSTDAERAFSRGHLTVSRLRHSLSEESVRASTVLGSWANIPGLVPEAEIVELLKQNTRRPRAADTNVPTAGPSAAATTSGTSGALGSSGTNSKKAGTSKSAGKAKASAIEVDSD